MAGGDYGRIRHTFWTDPDIKRSLTPEQKVLLLYWFSSPHSNMVGLFYCPLEYVALETGLPLDKVREWTLGALSRFVSYDEKTEEVLVHRAAKHQITEHLQATDKRLKAIKRSLAEAHSKPLLRAFLKLYADWPLGIEAPPEPEPSEIECLEAPSKGHSKPHRSHSSAVQCIAIQDGSKDPTAAPPKVETETDPYKELHRLRSAAVPLIQTHLWLGDKPPKPGWHTGRDLSIWNEMLKQFSPHEINGAITVCRTVVHEEIGMHPITMEYFNAKGKRDRMSRCVAAWRQSETRKLAAERRGLRLIGDDLEEVVRAAAG